MHGIPITDHFVVRGLGIAAGIARGRGNHASHVLVDRLDSPEASARKDGNFLTLGIGDGLVNLGFGEGRAIGVRCGVSQIGKQCYGTEHHNEANKPASGDLHPKTPWAFRAPLFVY